VKIHCAWRFHAIAFIQHDFGRNPTNRGPDRRNGAVTSQHNHGPLLVRRMKLVKTDVASRDALSFGHAASGSHAVDGPDVLKPGGLVQYVREVEMQVIPAL
jgi:hypothetical protein